MQYMGLGLYVVAEAVIFVPLLYVAANVRRRNGINVIGIAGMLTAVVFTGLTGDRVDHRRRFLVLCARR